MAITGWKKINPVSWQNVNGPSIWITKNYPSQFWHGSGYHGWFVFHNRGKLIAPKTPDTPRGWTKELTRAEALKIAMKYMRENPV